MASLKVFKRDISVRSNSYVVFLPKKKNNTSSTSQQKMISPKCIWHKLSNCMNTHPFSGQPDPFYRTQPKKSWTISSNSSFWTPLFRYPFTVIIYAGTIFYFIHSKTSSVKRNVYLLPPELPLACFSHICLRLPRCVWSLCKDPRLRKKLIVQSALL